MTGQGKTRLGFGSVLLNNQLAYTRHQERRSILMGEYLRWKKHNREVTQVVKSGFFEDLGHCYHLSLAEGLQLHSKL